MASFLDTYNKMSSAPMYSFEGSDKDEMLGAFRKMAQGASLESSDEIEASLRSIFGDKTYKENYDEIHENLDMFEEKYPVADNMSYLTGMASTAAVGFTPKMIKLASTLSPAKLGALVGLFEGTMASEPGLSNRASGGALGTILGGTIGKTLEKVSPGVLNLLNKFKTETPPSALPSGNMSDSIQALRDSAEKLRSEKGALPVSSKPTVAELRREANIQKFGYDPNDIVDTSYRMQHTPNPEGARLDDMTGGGEVFPDDIYSSQGLRYYGNPNNKFDRESFEIIQEVRGNPDAEVTIYRAVPDKAEIDLINSGDFVTLSRDYAEMHGAGGYGVDGQQAGKILSKKVKVKDLFSEGNDLNEFGYFPQKETDDLTDSIKALRDSAKKLNFRS